MRGRVLLVGVSLVAVTGCAQEPVAVPPVAPPTVAPRPASAAGGACKLLDYATIEKMIGARFDISVATKRNHTRTCVVQAQAASRPDLALSVTKTPAGADIFAETLVPDGARTVNGLGKAAYQLIAGPTKKRGARVEIGWLSDDGSLVNLRYTMPASADKDDAEELAPKLVDLAKKIDDVKAKA